MTLIIHSSICLPQCLAWHESKKGAETAMEDKLMQLMQRVRNGVANQPGKVWPGGWLTVGDEMGSGWLDLGLDFGRNRSICIRVV